MTARELLTSVEKDKMERLRWVVLNRFGVFPMSAEGKAVTDEEILICAVQMVLDRGVHQGVQSGEGFENESFDEELFKKLAEGAK